MPIKLLGANTLYRIKDLRVNMENTGACLSANPGHSMACVICVSQSGVKAPAELPLQEDDLNILYNGANLDYSDNGVKLYGLARRQLSLLSGYRGIDLTPPVCVQVWGMWMDPTSRDITLYMPDDSKEQYVIVPVQCSADFRDGQLTVTASHTGCYRDGDLMYQIGNRLPIPIPKTFLGQPIPMRPGAIPRVLPAPGNEERYNLKNLRGASI